MATMLLFFAFCALSFADTQVNLKTSKGDIGVKLYDDEAPITVANFLTYVDEGFYDGLVFHRVISNFMIQGGGMTSDLKRRDPTHDEIENESYNNLGNNKYTLAMARTHAPNSASSQFYINTADNSFLNKAKARDGVG